MDFEWSADQELLAETVTRFLRERAPISPYVRSRLDDELGFGADVWAGLADLGVVGLLAPDADGGAGMGMVDVAVVLETLGRFVHPGPYLASAVGAISLVTLAGSDSDRAELLPGLSAGETIGTVALWEPGRRAVWRDPTAVATSADGTWRVTGTKVFVPDADAADVLLVVAAAGDEIGVFAVAPNDDGVTVTRTPTVDETRRFATVELADAPGHRLGTGDATAAVAEVVDRIGVAMVIDGVGAAEQALALAVDYAKERHQFGKPIGSFQAVQHLCADMLRAVELTRAAAYYAAWACDAAGAAERHRAATMAQAYAADGLYGVAASAIQVFAGIGFTWEHDVHLFYKRLLTLQQHAGGEADQLEELATIVLDSGV